MRTYTWDYDNNLATEWLRQGECNQCGECCLVMISIRATGEENQDARDGGTGTTQKGLWHQWDGNGDSLYWKVEKIDHAAPCTCHSDYGCPPQKAYICEAWPLHPAHVECFNNCSYRFVKLNEREFEPYECEGELEKDEEMCDAD